MKTEIVKPELIGFNCKRYGNHILYEALKGYTKNQLFVLSKELIENHNDGGKNERK